MDQHVHPGEPAPEDGDYQEHNVMGSPGIERVTVRRGAPLPALPMGFTWKLVDHNDP
jgi:hypothetical protein